MSESGGTLVIRKPWYFGCLESEREYRECEYNDKKGSVDISASICTVNRGDDIIGKVTLPCWKWYTGYTLLIYNETGTEQVERKKEKDFKVISPSVRWNGNILSQERKDPTIPSLSLSEALSCSHSKYLPHLSGPVRPLGVRSLFFLSCEFLSERLNVCVDCASRASRSALCALRSGYCVRYMVRLTTLIALSWSID